MTRPRIHPDRTAAEPHSLFHAAQPEACSAPVGNEPDPVIGDVERDFASAPFQLHDCGSRVCMLDDVAQRFLRDSVHSQRGVSLNAVESVSGLEGHRQAMVLRRLGAVLLQRGDQARMLQHARMELVREVPDGVGQ